MDDQTQTATTFPFKTHRISRSQRLGQRIGGLLIIVIAGLNQAAQGATPWTLEHAIQHALTNSPDARIAQLRIRSAEAALQQAQAVFWPRLQFQSSYTRTDNPMLVFGAALNQESFSDTLDFNDVPDADNLNVKGLLRVPLYAGGKNMAGRDAAIAGTRASRDESEAVRNQLAFSVAKMFYTAQKTRAFIVEAEAAVSSYETNVVIAERRQAAGASLKTEVLDLSVRLAAAKEDMVRARHGHALTLRALASLLGLDQKTIDVSDISPDIAPPLTDDFSGRPEMAALLHRQEQAEARLREARSGHLPRVDAFGSLDYDYGFHFDGSGRSYSAGILLQWDLWDGKLTRARVHEVEIQQTILQEEEHKLRLTLGLQAQEARQHLKDAEERLDVTAQTVELAKESVKLTRARFEEGLALATQLIDAETALTSARVRRLEAESNRRIAIAELRKALGLPQLPDDQNEPTSH